MAFQTPSRSQPVPPATPVAPGAAARIRPLREAFGAALVVFVASALGIVVTWYFATEAQWLAARHGLMQIARIAASRLDLEAHRRVAAGEAGADVLLATLVSLVRATDGVTSIRTVVERDGQFHLVLDSRTAYRPPGDVRGSVDGRLRADGEAERRLAVATRAVTVTAVRRTPSGPFLTAYAPLLDRAGGVTALVGVDLPLHDVEARAARLGRVTLAALAGVLALSVVAGLVVYPLRRVAARAEAHDRQTAAALESARDAAERSSRAKTSFVAMMSHELRTPLNAIVGYSEMMHDELTARGQQRLAADIAQVRTAGRRLVEIVSDVLDFSKMDAGRLELGPAPVDVPALMRDIEAVVGPEAEAKGLTLTVDLAPGVREVVADADRVRQILTNLLRNAVKFSARGGIAVRVRALPGDTPRVVWAIHDTGQGIPADKRGLLFQPFTQVDGSFTRAAGGTGLGLVISHRLAAAMGGTLTVRSQVGRGSTFRVSLPHRGLAAA